jgi:hypothetical protein
VITAQVGTVVMGGKQDFVAPYVDIIMKTHGVKIVTPWIYEEELYVFY